MDVFSAFMDNGHHGTLIINATNILNTSHTNVLNI